jgi:hypothetical protein
MLEPSVAVPLQTSSAYPAPPRVHWAVLLIVSMVASALFEWSLPETVAEFAITSLWGAWIFYLCSWIRRLDPNSKSLAWALASIGMQFVLDGLDLIQDPSLALNWVICGLWVTSLVLDFVVIFEIRAELQTHYNEREPIGLHLSGALTFFFSYLYFQYHFYEIAQFKKRQAEGSIENAGRALIP